MADSWMDLIGVGLDAYASSEQRKIDARLIQSREQIAAYEYASKTQNTAAADTVKAGENQKWLILAGAGLAALLVYVAVIR